MADVELVIKVPEEYYKWLKNKDYRLTSQEVIANGTPIPKDATNGDVIKAMFPTAKFYCAERLQTAGMPRRNADFDVDWWNAPYKGVDE